jgi:hypothetical protein
MTEFPACLLIVTAEVDAVTAAPGPAGVRVWQIMLR